MKATALLLVELMPGYAGNTKSTSSGGQGSYDAQHEYLHRYLQKSVKLIFE